MTKLQEILETLLDSHCSPRGVMHPTKANWEVCNCSMCQYLQKQIPQAISAIEGLVPREKEEKGYLANDPRWLKDCGWNLCREEMLRRVK